MTTFTLPVIQVCPPLTFEIDPVLVEIEQAEIEARREEPRPLDELAHDVERGHILED